MAKPWNGARPRQAPVAPSTLTEITRRYHGTALALAKTLGVPFNEQFLHDYRESIACCYIEAGRSGVRLGAEVKLAPLTAPSPPPLPVDSSGPVEPTPPPATNGHPPTPPTKGGPKTLPKKSDLLREVQTELTRIGRRVGELPAVYQAAFGEDVSTWELVCDESLHILRHGLAYLRTLTPEVSNGAQSTPAQSAETSATPAPAAEVPQDPQPAASGSAAGFSSAPEVDTAESLLAFALSVGLEEATARRIIKMHRNVAKCKTVLVEAAARNKRKTA